MPAGQNNFNTAKLVEILQTAREPITNVALAERVGIGKTTIDGWLRQGKEKPESSYGEFARAWHAIRPPQERMDEAQRLKAIRDALDVIAAEEDEPLAAD